MDHTMAVGTKQRQIFESCFIAWGKCVQGLSVMRFDKPRAMRSVGIFEIERTRFTLQASM
jgi:hypothetical protein